MSEIIRGYKGLDINFQCRGVQFEAGKTYAHDGEVKACESGFHFCERPQDVWNYYAPADSRFAEVVGRGEISRHGDDSKIACSEIEIVREIGLREMIDLCIADTWERAEKMAGTSATGNLGAASATGNLGAASATGYRGAASATGYRGAASATGNLGAASATGNLGAASATGEHSIACALGYACRAIGCESSWLVLCERDDEGKILGVVAVPVDGEAIKAGTWYELIGGEVKEARG